MKEWRFRMIGFVASFLVASPAIANSPWLSLPGTLNTSVTGVYERFTEFYQAEDLTPFPFENMNQASATFSFEYGIVENASIDASIGWVGTFSDPYTEATGVDLLSQGGLNDVKLGLNWQLVDEFEQAAGWVPSVTARFGGIIAGTYEIDNVFPGAPGEKAYGVEFDVALGKVLPAGFGISATTGVRVRTDKVPIEWKLRVDSFYNLPGFFVPRFLEAIVVSFAYDQVRSTSGLDLGRPPFEPTAEKARQLKEWDHLIEPGLGFQDRAGRYYSLFYAHTVFGRNTGKKNIVGLSITLPWDVPSF